MPGARRTPRKLAAIPCTVCGRPSGALRPGPVIYCDVCRRAARRQRDRERYQRRLGGVPPDKRFSTVGLGRNEPAAGVVATEPCEAAVGTRARVDAYRARLERGEPLWCEEDRELGA